MSAPVDSWSSIDWSVAELNALVDRLGASSARHEDVETVKTLVDSYGHLTHLIDDKDTTIGRLRKYLFGSTSEKKDKILGTGEGAKPRPKPHSKPKPKGHGRNGAKAYPGATRTVVEHESLRPGNACPNPCSGKVYLLEDPARSVRLFGRSPVGGEVEERERFRCNLCGEVFTAAAPADSKMVKYDPTAVSMVALLRYGSGFPFNRIEDLQRFFGIPLPGSTQWDIVHRAVAMLVPIYDELRRLAAQGSLLHNDDTPMTILSVEKEARERRERGEAPPERTGVFTTGIVAIGDGWQIELFATGVRHAGENLLDILTKRAPGLPPPQQMCDGLERNLPSEFKTIVGNCLTHLRRQFADVFGGFPDEVRHVVEELSEVYRNEATAKEEGMSPEERLAFHQRESGPVMEDLRAWLDALLEEKEVEPNSGLGKAILYAQKRWKRLTLFLSEAGSPLDNNVCERLLKRAILHRKNSLFYKTENGARVGDVYMSLIATAKKAQVDPFDYLTELQRHASEVAAAPGDWLPWTYRATLAAPDPPA